MKVNVEKCSGGGNEYVNDIKILYHNKVSWKDNYT